MKKLWTLLLVPLLFAACEKESVLRLSGSEAIAQYLPNFASPPLYSNGTDSIRLQLISQRTYHEEAPGTEGAGSLGDFEKIELERREVLTGVDTPYIRINFESRSLHHPSSPTRSKDVLSVRLSNAHTDFAELQLEYIDSVRCLSSNCTFSDTLMLDSLSYQNVYHLSNDTAGAALFLNQEQDVVAFKIPGGTLYKRLN